VPAVQVALGLASVTAGGLLGAFLIGLFLKRATQGDVLVAVATSAAAMLTFWIGSKGWLPVPFAKAVSWPWYSLMGCAIALGAAWVATLRHRAGPRPS
jgi:SSS family solute:Na+ symporter